MVLAASARYEAAREDKNLKSDIYTYFFLDALTKGDRNQDGQVSILEAHDYATSKTLEHTRYQQRPTFESKVIGNLDFPLSGRKTYKGLPFLSAYDQYFENIKLALNGQTKGSLPAAFPLTSGKNEVSLYREEDGEQKLIGTYVVRADDDEILDLKDIITPPPFALTHFVRRKFLRDQFANIIGKRSLDGGGMAFYFRYKILELGIESSFENAKNKDFKPEISAEMTGAEIGVTAGVRQNLWHTVDGSVGGRILNSSLQLDLTDQTSDQKISRSQNILNYGLYGSLHWNFVRQFWWDLRLDSVPSSKHRFDNWGSVDTSYFAMSAGVYLGIWWKGGKNKMKYFILIFLFRCGLPTNPPATNVAPSDGFSFDPFGFVEKIEGAITEKTVFTTYLAASKRVVSLGLNPIKTNWAEFHTVPFEGRISIPLPNSEGSAVVSEGGLSIVTQGAQRDFLAENNLIFSYWLAAPKKYWYVGAYASGFRSIKRISSTNWQDLKITLPDLLDKSHKRAVLLSPNADILFLLDRESPALFGLASNTDQTFTNSFTNCTGDQLLGNDKSVELSAGAFDTARASIWLVNKDGKIFLGDARDALQCKSMTFVAQWSSTKRIVRFAQLNSTFLYLGSRGWRARIFYF